MICVFRFEVVKEHSLASQAQSGFLATRTKVDCRSNTLLHLGVVRGEVAMVIINQKLTPLYVQYEAIQAQQKMVNSPNHPEVYIPVGPMGVPVVGTMKLGQEGRQ